MEKKKLKLDELQVQSFVTAFDKKDGATQDVMGGTWWAGCDIPTAQDFSCWYTGTCDSSRCSEQRTNVNCC